ncbi:hypothetical protein GCM10011316_27190 [Roseibium aquae]|uniref:Flagellar biosynthesis protein FlgF n=1 Tax=Roseibium aquae TaxID=1323746 RepID=A0A916TKZ0_9HYPH|nr:DUF1217 domain-containing protein [Roseibium aquae]GGB53727.1 hypothetical protein GCM10011316_27190 [Roseibium aquae]
MIGTLAQYQLVTTNMDRSLKTIASDPTVERQSAYYLENIENIKSIDDFMADERIYRYAMKAHGLEDMIYAKAFIRKVLEEGIDRSDSFANKLTDERYKAFAETFNFARNGEVTTIFQKAKQPVVDMYMRQTLEENEGSKNEGVRLALYFARKAPDIQNAFEILADRALAETVYVALGVGKEFAATDIDRQADFISERIDFEDFKDPEKLDRFLQRFTALYDLQNGGPAAASIPSMLIGGGAPLGLDQNLLSSLQNLKLGGR